GSESALVNAFKPPPNATTAWVSNLHLAKAISQWGTLDKSQRNPGRDRLETVSAIIGHRLLGYSMVVDFQNSVSASAQDSGNLLKSLADNARESGKDADAANAYNAATRLYIQAVVDPNNPSIAALYKVIADSLLNFGIISGSKGDLDK